MSTATKKKPAPKLTGITSKLHIKPTAQAGNRLSSASAVAIKKETAMTDGPAKEVRAKTARFNTKFIKDKKIKILAEKNPKRPSSDAFKIFELYKNGILATTFIEKGGSISALKYDVNHGHISLED